MSRAALREAVRLLEFHSIAQMRRGPGGGLVVTKPQPQASIDTIALCLQYRRPNREDLRCVRDAIEIDNVAKVVAKVVKRCGETEVAAFLATQGSVLHGDARAIDVRAVAVEEFRFHVGLAQRAGNALLELFLRIIVELFRRNWTSAGQALPTWGDVVAVRARSPADSRGDPSRRRQPGPLSDPAPSGCGGRLVALGPPECRRRA